MHLNNPWYMKEIGLIAEKDLPWIKLKGKTILIAGATGQICTCLIDCLIYRNEKYGDGIKVYALCRNRNKAIEYFDTYLKTKNEGEFSLIIQDVCMPLVLSDIRCDYIIHAAMSTQPADHLIKPVEIMRSGIIGTISLLEYARKSEIERFLFLSSSMVYGTNNPAGQILTEEYCGTIDYFNAKSAYSESKRSSECLSACYAREYGVDAVIARPGYVYGIDAAKDNNRVEMRFFKTVLNKKNIILKTTGNQLRSYSYIFDTVSALLYILLLGEKNEAYNVANGNSAVSIREFAQSLADITGTALEFENPADKDTFLPPSGGNGIIDIKKLESLGYKSMYNIRDGQINTLEILKNRMPYESQW